MNTARISISPDIVKDIARLTTLATPGVVGLADAPTSVLHRSPPKGVDVEMIGELARITLHVTAATDQSLPALGAMIKRKIAGAVEEIAGIKVESISVSFEDVRIAA